MIVFGSSMSPYVRKVLAFAAEKGIEVESRRVAPGTDDPDFRAASPLGRIPALQDGDFRISDSSAIIAYLDALQPDPVLIPSTPQARARTIWFEEFADVELFAGPGRAMFRNRIVLPYLVETPGDLAAADKAQAEDLPRLLDYLEGEMTAGGFLVEDRLTLADIAIASVLANLLHAGETIDRWPKVKEFAERMHARPSFASWIEQERAFIERRKAGASGKYSHSAST